VPRVNSTSGRCCEHGSRRRASRLLAAPAVVRWQYGAVVHDAAPEPLGPLPIPDAGRRLTAVFRDTAQYAMGGLAYKAVALVSVPILARLLEPSQLGVLDLAVVIALVVSIAGMAGLENGLARLDAEDQGNARTWGSAATLLVLGIALIGATTLVLSPLIARLLLGDSDSADVIRAGIAYGCVLAGTTMGLNALRLKGRPMQYAVTGFVIVTAEMAAALTLAALGAPIAVVVLGWAAASLLGTVVLLVRPLPRLGRPSTVTMRRLLLFGLPLVPAIVVWIIGDLGVRAVVAQSLDLTALGQYGIAGRIASGIQLLVTGFGLAWHPFLYRSERHLVRHLAIQASLRMTAALGGVAIVLTAVAPEIVRVVAGPGYDGAAEAVPGLAASMVLFGLITVATAVLGYDYATRFVAIASLAGAGLQVGAASVIVPALGLAGAGLAVASGYAVTFVLLTWRAKLGQTRSVATIVVVAFALGATSALVGAALPVRLSVALASVAVIAIVWLTPLMLKRGAGRTPRHTDSP
jgi:O-antigen/teichoic acid export membrane protein